jgi:hypothetical protein
VRGRKEGKKGRKGGRREGVIKRKEKEKGWGLDIVWAGNTFWIVLQDRPTPNMPIPNFLFAVTELISPRVFHLQIFLLEAAPLLYTAHWYLWPSSNISWKSSILHICIAPVSTEWIPSTQRKKYQPTAAIKITPITEIVARVDYTHQSGQRR